LINRNSATAEIPRDKIGYGVPDSLHSYFLRCFRYATPRNQAVQWIWTCYSFSACKNTYVSQKLLECSPIIKPASDFLLVAAVTKAQSFTVAQRPQNRLRTRKCLRIYAQTLHGWNLETRIYLSSLTIWIYAHSCQYSGLRKMR